MNTRKRKQVLTAIAESSAAEQKSASPQQLPAAAPIQSKQETTNISGSSNNNNKNNILRAFLETWLDTKRDLSKTRKSTTDELNEEISKRLIDQGYQVSSKLVKHKIASFVKKYQYVQKCEREGKKIEWCNYDIVRQIFDLEARADGMGGGIVVIPRQNIKSEDDLNIDDDFVGDKNGNGATAQTQTQQTKVKEERVELIEIPDEDTYTQKKQTEE